jgi:hypothetical protein
MGLESYVSFNDSSDAYKLQLFSPVNDLNNKNPFSWSKFELRTIKNETEVVTTESHPVITGIDRL